MKGTTTILKRELRGYFTTPVAYVFIVIFLLLTGILTFYMGGFFEREQHLVVDSSRGDEFLELDHADALAQEWQDLVIAADGMGALQDPIDVVELLPEQR